MNRALVKLSKVKQVKPPAGLAQLFDDPPLVGDEKREDYDNLFSAVAAAIDPVDAIAWLLTRDIADLSWEIKRERRLKLQVIKSQEIEVVRRLLIPPKPEFTMDLEDDPNDMKKEAEQWGADPKARRGIDKTLIEMGYDASYIFRTALNRAAEHIDAIDRRIASYELRRMAAMRALEHYSEALARRVKAASDVIEGELTEAAE